MMVVEDNTKEPVARNASQLAIMSTCFGMMWMMVFVIDLKSSLTLMRRSM